MDHLYKNASKDFLELSSEQRLEILFNLLSQRSKITTMAKKLGATVQEVHRNFERLTNAGLIVKNSEGEYQLTTYGKTICNQVPDLVFVSRNKQYFEKHDFGDIPAKFIQRIGALSSGQHIKGVVKVLEKWKEIYVNSNKYVYEVLSEVPLDLIESLVTKIKRDNIEFQYIYSESVIVPKGRKQLLAKLGFSKLLEKGLVERKMKKNVRIVTILNEKEACVMFPTLDGEPDIREMFFGTDPLFHEWCLDYFRYCWYGSDVFKEHKLQE